MNLLLQKFKQALNLVNSELAVSGLSRLIVDSLSPSRAFTVGNDELEGFIFPKNLPLLG